MSDPFKILVVDDSPTQLLLMKGILKQDPNFEVLTAENGEEALAIIGQSAPNLVLTDLQMPGINGMELVEATKGVAPSVPVILTTSQGSEEIAAKALRMGAASYVPKRDLATGLMPTIRQVMQVMESAQTPGDVSSCLQSSSLSFCLSNDEKLVPGLISRLESPLVELGLFDEGERMQISMALDEALLNAMIHGNLEVSSKLRETDDGKAYRELIETRSTQEPYHQRRVRVEMDASRQSVRFVIRDEGKGFDVDSLPDPTDPANLENASGRGLLLINAFMDEVKHNETGNEITLIKNVEHTNGDAVGVDV